MKSVFTSQIERKLLAIKPFTNHKFFGESYIGGGESRLQYLNIKIPKVRDIFKTERLETKNLPDIENLWFKSEIFEAKTLAVIWLENQSTEFILKNFNKISKWSTEIDNWALSDGYCSILARAFEADSKKLLPIYKKWNQHKNPWLRRISMVGLFYYSRGRKTQPSFQLAINIIKPHLAAPEYYVQKAVGWTLRECYNVYPEKTTEFVTASLSKIHPDAWYAASEKMPKSVKNKLVLKRRENRKS
jgi:3-methyladenine DNA glycosylase AlkD